MALRSEVLERRTQSERREGSARLLLQAAINVVTRDGVGAITFDNVGRTGGVSRGLASQRFGSKQRLIQALVAHLQDTQENMVTQAGLDHLPGLEATLGYVRLVLDAISAGGETQAYFMLLSSAVADASELRTVFAECHARFERRVEAWVLRGQAEGDIRREMNAEAVALMIGCLLLGLSMQLLIDSTMRIEPVREASLAALRLSLGTAQAG